MHHDITVHRVVKSSKRAGQYIEPHIHAFFHFIYGLDGHLQVQVGAKRIQTKPGILVMVPPGGGALCSQPGYLHQSGY